MSYLNDFLDNSDCRTIEVEKGVFFERRGFLRLSAFGLCSLLLSTNTLLKSQEEKTQGENVYDLKKMIEELTPKASALIKDEKIDEEKYLNEVMIMVKKLQNTIHAGITNKKIHFTSMHDALPIKIYQIRMLPGAVLPCHDHRDYNGIIQVLDGSANVRNFDFADEKKYIQKAETFKVKETQNITAKKDDIMSLSRTRDNIHEIIAGPEGILFLDIFTFYNNKGTSKYLKLEKKPLDEKEKIFTASWRK